MALPDNVRAHCAEIASGSRHVRIVDAAIEPYARSLPAAPAPRAPVTDEREAAFLLQLNAINFGSGWFPTLRKPPGLSGFRTVEAGLKAHGPYTRDELRAMTPARIATALGQDPRHELMALFAAALRELGEQLGSVPEGDAVEVAERLARLPTWSDPGFFKRAQIAAAALGRPGTERLTMFADNLVPHVLRLDGVLTFDDDLAERIERGELLEHGSREEVEIRACAVHAVELLVAAHGATTAAAVDEALWERGAGARYKARPRHRSRTIAY
jgi:hypothetical protein